MSILEELEQRAKLAEETESVRDEYFPMLETDRDYPIHDDEYRVTPMTLVWVTLFSLGVVFAVYGLIMVFHELLNIHVPLV